jgi:hypothetical protein
MMVVARVGSLTAAFMAAWRPPCAAVVVALRHTPHTDRTSLITRGCLYIRTALITSSQLVMWSADEVSN